MYQVLNWERHFEGAKSKGYKNKTSCSLPCKHGLGYKRLIRSKNGPALFGAWCSLIQVLSRHQNPRNGWCTDDGSKHGRPYTCDDLEIMTDIPAKYFKEMFDVCKSHHVGWVKLTKVKDTAGDCQGTIVPLNSDLNSNSSKPENDTVSVYDDFLKKFNTASGKRCRIIDDKTKRQFNARIKEGFSVDEIIEATINCAKDDYHKENPKYLTPEFITRSDKLQKYLNIDSVHRDSQQEVDLSEFV